ncbi:predicted protein [Sclerotinia sclerotiorum 1980 UF-70]|uniref:Uncharacterized protein n=1 Tax=Sclerotinia sclerotiorum (strain ATCC 18683 / 1980 / Ss-1) TaxID=665079 RepID=A7ENT1_SCLS1|nr:predicted protein [Sclerotinia sclerotiorum 1980 UF-70]EDO04497.1 predicted protein [Sclerotinia sclerotiorum 1980 UF-70]
MGFFLGDHFEAYVAVESSSRDQKKKFPDMMCIEEKSTTSIQSKGDGINYIDDYLRVKFVLYGGFEQSPDTMNTTDSCSGVD